MDNTNELFIKSIKEAEENYRINGKRSNKKILPIHSFINYSLTKNLDPKKYKVISLTKDNKTEGKVKTICGNKNVDVLVIEKNTNKNILIIEVKYFCSSYAKNARNYIENMVGETQLLKTNEDKPIIWQLIITPTYMPVYNKDNVLKSLDYFDEERIKAYININKNKELSPTFLSLFLIDTGNEQYLKNNIGQVIDVKSESFENNLHIQYANIETKNKNISEFINNDFQKDIETAIHTIKMNKLNVI